MGSTRYNLSFSSAKHSPGSKTSPTKIYFNLDRDTLYFGPDWNKDTGEMRGCLSLSPEIVLHEDFKQVKGVAFHLGMNACVHGSQIIHMPDIRNWAGVKDIYLVLDERAEASNQALELGDMRAEDWPAFMKAYRSNPSFPTISDEYDDLRAFEKVRVDWKRYCHPWIQYAPTEFCSEISAARFVKG